MSGCNIQTLLAYHSLTGPLINNSDEVHVIHNKGGVKRSSTTKPTKLVRVKVEQIMIT
ncbi:hypothetical protein MtrunA17_Chr3g0144561 [Medicago truncatula]|uniref:Uncharacterized protein n=1 Tax=Medicago truncatula TaxID=3880 RepID=A0A396J7V9_MEDTR|nr:hypothetical protein MtrunA17_Chr3g0144561 [Medicago truncatula]